MKQQQKVQPVGCLMVFIFGIIIIFLIRSISGGSDKDTHKVVSYDPPDNTIAYLQSIDFVKQYLKSPSTADFDKFTGDPDVSNPTDNEYVISYHFDAENSFGAKLRSTYVCTLKYVTGDPSSIYNWELEHLIIDDKVIR